MTIGEPEEFWERVRRMRNEAVVGKLLLEKYKLHDKAEEFSKTKGEAIRKAIEDRTGKLSGESESS